MKNRMKWKSGGGYRGRETPGLIGSAAVGEMRNLAAALSISWFERSRWRLRRTRDAVRKSGFGRAIAYWNFQGNRDTCLGDVATYCLSRHIAVALPNNITGQRPQRQRFCSNRHFGQWTGRSVVVYPQSPPKFRGKAIRRSCYERQSASIRAAVQDFRQRSIDVRFAAFQAAGCLVPIWETQRHQGVQIQIAAHRCSSGLQSRCSRFGSLRGHLLLRSLPARLICPMLIWARAESPVASCPMASATSTWSAASCTTPAQMCRLLNSTQQIELSPGSVLAAQCSTSPKPPRWIPKAISSLSGRLSLPISHWWVRCIAQTEPGVAAGFVARVNPSSLGLLALPHPTSPNGGEETRSEFLSACEQRHDRIRPDVPFRTSLDGRS